MSSYQSFFVDADEGIINFSCPERVPVIFDNIKQESTLDTNEDIIIALLLTLLSLPGPCFHEQGTQRRQLAICYSEQFVATSKPAPHTTSEPAPRVATIKPLAIR